MLTELNAYAVVPAENLRRAREFYKTRLGLEPERVTDAGLLYRTGDGSTFLLQETNDAGGSPNIVMGWASDDIDADVEALRARGVVFDEIDETLDPDDEGIVGGGEGRVACFRDSEGNTLCISQAEPYEE